MYSITSFSIRQVPRKRLIIGQDSFDLDRDGQLMTEDEEWEARHGPSPKPMTDDPALEDKDKDEEDGSDGASEGGDGASDRHRSLSHKDSVWSMASSATSVDSNEEELRDQRRRLQLSLTRRTPTNTASDTQDAPSTPAESLDSTLMVCTH